MQTLIDKWDDLTHDNQTTIVVFGIVALTVVAVAMLILLHDVLLRAGI